MLVNLKIFLMKITYKYIKNWFGVSVCAVFYLTKGVFPYKKKIETDFFLTILSIFISYASLAYGRGNLLV